MKTPPIELLISVLIFVVVAVLANEDLSLSSAFWIAIAAILYFLSTAVLYVLAEDPFGDFPYLNLLLAWTGFGWVVLLSIALLSKRYGIRPLARGLARSRAVTLILRVSSVLLGVTTLFTLVLGGSWFVGSARLSVWASIVGNEAILVFGGMSFFLWYFSAIGTYVFFKSYRPWMLANQ